MKNVKLESPLDFMERMSALAAKLDKGEISAEAALAQCATSREYVRQANLTLQMAKATGKPLPEAFQNLLDDKT